MRKILTEQVFSGDEDSPLDALVEQLWQTPVASGDIRVVANPRRSSAWRDVERYWILPSLKNPQMLIPRGNRIVTAAALLSYRALRRPKVRLARSVLGGLAAIGLPASLDTLSVQQKTGASTPTALPLAEMSRNLAEYGWETTGNLRCSCSMQAAVQLVTQNSRGTSPAAASYKQSKRSWHRCQAALSRCVCRDLPEQERGRAILISYPRRFPRRSTPFAAASACPPQRRCSRCVPSTVTGQLLAPPTFLNLAGAWRPSPHASRKPPLTVWV